MARLLSYDESRLFEALRQYRILLKTKPDAAVIQLEAADILLRLKQYEEAIVLLQRVRDNRPNHLNALIMLARAYLWNQQYAEAIIVYEDLPEREKNNPLMLELLARAYARNRQYDRAIDVYLRRIQTVPASNAEIYMELADAYLYSKKIPLSIPYYRRAFRLSSGNDKIRKKLALALSWNGQEVEALPLLIDLINRFPQDHQVAQALIRSYTNAGPIEKALDMARRRIRKYPEYIGYILELADLEARLGHARACRDLYLQALRNPDATEAISVRFADRMQMWGDFYKALTRYRQYLQRHPNDLAVRFKQAGTLASSQRFEEAEGILRQLKSKNYRPANVQLEVAKLRSQENHLKGALQEVEGLFDHLGRPADDPSLTGDRHKAEFYEGLFLKGQLLLRMKKYDEAVQAFQTLCAYDPKRIEGLIGLGKSYLKLNQPLLAKYSFARAETIAPKNVAVRFYNAGQDLQPSPDLLKDIIGHADTTPMSMAEWARLYTSHGHYPEAIEMYRAAVNKDPHCFTARIALCEVLGTARHYDASIAGFESLAAEFPENSKIGISMARVLGWSKQYDRSMKVYDRLHRLEPSDPVPIREKARTAVWDKKMDTAMALYASLWETSVDQKLLAAMEKIGSKSIDADMRALYRQLQNATPKGSIFTAYEWFVEKLNEMEGQGGMKPELSRLKALRDKLYPDFRLQKAAYLESRSKWLAWNNRFIPALEKYEELIDFQPGNQEAIFDYAQVQCALGMCDEEAQTYQDLLTIAPLHDQAELGLEKHRNRKNPSLAWNYTFWDETGRGDLSQIYRHQSRLSLDVPVLCKNHLKLAAIRWDEHPKKSNRDYQAYGHRIELNSIVSPCFSGGIGWTKKYYQNHGLPDRDTGYANIWLNFRDYFRLGTGYDRSNMIYNDFGIQQGVQADNWWVALKSPITRELEISGKATSSNYSDDNAGEHLTLSTSYIFTDHPRVFKVTLTGDHRNTQNESIYHYNNQTLTSITHPYWTPQDYWGGAVTLEWYHDISEDFFCGADLHYYDLRVTFGTDSENNSACAFEADWHYEFSIHWLLQLKGLVHRSEQWDANGFWATIQYRF